MTEGTFTRAKVRRLELQRLRADPRYRRVMGFLVAKGLLTATDIAPLPTVKISLADALWVGETLEPRVLEILPAALAHFPRTFLGRAEMPADLGEVLRAVQRGDPAGPPFRGVPYERVMRWATLPLPDKRTRPLAERRVARTFRMKPELLARLAKQAARTRHSQTDLLEQALSRFLKERL